MTRSAFNKSHMSLPPKMSLRRVAYLGCSALTALAFADSAMAQSGDSDRVLESIIVTAEKKETTVQDTPIAITAIGQENIERRGIQNIADLQQLAPGLSYNQIGPTGFITMRGIGVDFTQINAEPGVAFHVDGSYRGGSMAPTLAMFDLERIEVVRGPQGTLNGRNSTGGSINVHSRLPGEEASFEAGFLIGEYDRYRLELAGDLPVSDNFAIRLAGVREERGGYSRNITLNTDEDGLEYTILKGSAVWTPTDQLEFVLRGEYSDSEQTGPLYLYSREFPVAPTLTSPGNPGGVLNLPGNFCGSVSCADLYGIQFPQGVPPITNVRETRGETPTLEKVETSGISLTGSYQVTENITLKSISSYYDQELQGARDVDGTSLAFFTAIRNEKLKESSQELTLLGTTGKLDWTIGALYYESKSYGFYSFDIPALQPFFESLFGIAGGGGPLPAGSLAAFGAKIDGTSSAVPFLQDAFDEKTVSQAVYAQGTYDFTDWLRGTVGIRRTEDRKKFWQTSLDNLGGEQCIRQPSKQDWSETTGRIGLDADITDDVMLYASVSTGYRSGGFDTGACYDEFDPETVTSYEIGSKMDLSNTLRVNASAFVYDYKDYQAQLFTTIGVNVLNASGADIHGAEVELNWLASDKLRIDGALSYLDTSFKEFQAQDPMVPQDGVVSLKGNNLLRAPEWQASLTGEYDIPLNSGLVTLRGEYSYMAEQNWSLFNNPLGLEPSRSLVNARVFYQPAGHKNLTISAFVNNLTDKEYKTMYVLSGFVGGVTNAYGPPQTWGIQLRQKW